MWSVASLFLAGVIIAADDRHPGPYNEHIDKRNYGYMLKYVKDVHSATYHAKMIFYLQLTDWQVKFMT